jgi:hypothetical protein
MTALSALSLVSLVSALAPSAVGAPRVTTADGRTGQVVDPSTLSAGVAHVRLYEETLPDPVQTLERYFWEGGVSLVRAVFENTFFIEPSAVRARTPHFPGFARYSKKHYPGLRKGDWADWQGTPVRLDDNARAQIAWQKYAGRRLSRGTGYGLRHIWGHPWDPAAFTAGWNLAYMPHWAGMLTEAQHPHAEIVPALRQASWDLFFRANPVCAPPEFVSNPGINLGELLEGRPLLVLAGEVTTLPRATIKDITSIAKTTKRIGSLRFFIRHGRTSKNAKPASPAQIEKWEAQLKEELELRERLKRAQPSP